MKKLIYLFVMVMLVSGCGRTLTAWRVTELKTHIGMTKNEFLTSHKRAGFPSFVSKQVINGKTYETFCYLDVLSVDFVDNILVGYYSMMKYYSKDGVEDFENYQKQ